ncbi:MAG: formylglycine-generating enzyme family protein, partial [Desulfobacteraceae bacterium]
RLKEKKKKEKIDAIIADIQKYREIVSSPFGKDMAIDAWKNLVAKYPEAQNVDVGDTDILLYRAAGGVSGLGMQFVYIKPGTFIMGSPQIESGRDKDETVHRVTLTKGFYLQTTELTQWQWEKVMGYNPSYFKACGDNCPMEMVSFEDAQAFIRKINQLEGTNKYRLPTEAEWEYACRAGSKMRFCFGNNDNGLSDYAWYYKNVDNVTHSVATKRPNAWGLYDMHGNVWEWCQDWYGKYPRRSVTDAIGPSSGSNRVNRGGSFTSDARYCRSAERLRYYPGYRSNNLGFRLAKDCFD